MANRFERDKRWADGHRDEIDKVLRAVAARHVQVDESTFERDRTEAIDYEVELPETRVACRVRRISSCGKHRQLTIGTDAPPGGVSEATKLAGGQVDWYLYAWSDGDKFVQWMVVDMARVLRDGLLDNAMRVGDEVPWEEGAFLYIEASALERADAIVAASWMP